MALNANQQRFIQIYRSTTPRNATRAYEHVYTMRGDAASMSASRLIRNDKVAAEIARLDEEELRDLGVTRARILRELARCGFSDARLLYDRLGGLKDLPDLDAETAAAISAVEVVETVTDDDSPVLQRTKKVRLWSKIDSLKTLAQIAGLLKDKGDGDSDRAQVTIHIRF